MITLTSECLLVSDGVPQVKQTNTHGYTVVMPPTSISWNITYDLKLPTTKSGECPNESCTSHMKSKIFFASYYT